MISNILEQEDVVKGMPDAALQQEAQAPSGMLQQFLVISEIKRRTDMRKRHQNQMQEQPQGTVAEQIVMEGITGSAPQQGVGMPPQMGPQQMPPKVGHRCHLRCLRKVCLPRCPRRCLHNSRRRECPRWPRPQVG